MFSEQHIKRSPFLDMLFRHRETLPVKTSIGKLDLLLAQCICQTGLYPCTHQKLLQPEEFSTFQELCDFFDISDAVEDDDNEHLNDFLLHLGLEEDPGDDIIDRYEGWTEEMIADQERDDANGEMALLEEDEEDEEYWDEIGV